MPSGSQSPATYRFVLLRHGESVGNAEGRIQGLSDYPLTDNGREQAGALARRWISEKRSFDQVISSPLRRSRETAEILAEALNLPLEYAEIWMERDYGNLSGLTFANAVLSEGRPLYAYPYQPVGENGESLWDLYLRGTQALQRLMSRDPGQYLVVSHGGILNMVLYAILGIAPQAYLRGARFLFDNTGFAALIYMPAEHIWRVETLNDHSHIQNTK